MFLYIAKRSSISIANVVGLSHWDVCIWNNNFDSGGMIALVLHYKLIIFSVKYRREYNFKNLKIACIQTNTWLGICQCMCVRSVSLTASAKGLQKIIDDNSNLQCWLISVFLLCINCYL